MPTITELLNGHAVNVAFGSTSVTAIFGAVWRRARAHLAPPKTPPPHSVPGPRRPDLGGGEALGDAVHHRAGAGTRAEFLPGLDDLGADPPGQAHDRRVDPRRRGMTARARRGADRWLGPCDDGPPPRRGGRAGGGPHTA